MRLIFSSLLIAEKWSSLLCQFMVISRPLSPTTKAPDYYAVGVCIYVCVCVRVCERERECVHVYTLVRETSILPYGCLLSYSLSDGLSAVSFSEMAFFGGRCVCVGNRLPSSVPETLLALDI